jgi:hypothetical protein
LQIIFDSGGSEAEIREVLESVAAAVEPVFDRITEGQR